jgi:protein arginine kinase activator
MEEGRTEMNSCSKCGAPATIHFTSIVGASKQTRFLCEACARADGVVGSSSLAEGGALNLQALVALVLGNQPSLPKTEHLRCENCGLKYHQFKAEGRLGCADDYEVFEVGLMPLLEKIHRDVQHVGKVPRSHRDRTDLDQLRTQLQLAIADERYEDAAMLRDTIQQREKQS